MSIKLRILLFQLVQGLAVLAIAGLAYLTSAAMTEKLERVQWSRQQLDATTRLEVLANRYSEQIAELLLVGEPERPDFEEARAQLTEWFRESYELSRLEINALDDPAEQVEERRELERLDHMRLLLREIDRAVERLLLLSQEGRQQEAIALFREQIENRLDAELERLIVAAVSDERAEAERVDAEAATLARRLTLATVVALAAILASTIAVGVHFYGAIVPPLRALTEGALAIERGDLGHRVAAPHRDELGRLASRFNQMAEELERQRGLLLAAHTHLERQVVERTSELADANRRLSVLDQLRVRFLADVSHELRTPLTVLRGEAEVALRGMSKPESVYREALELIVKQAAEMGRLVEDLLFLARSEADEIRFELRPVGLATLVHDAVNDASLIARAKQIQLLFKPPAADVMIRADARRLRQVLLIVLDNATRYSPPHSVVQLAIRWQDAAAELTVADQGEGIPAEELPHVFNRFYRGERARAQGIGGSGLGLAIARRIVEKHEGKLALSSTLGGGTVVTLRLPRVS